MTKYLFLIVFLFSTVKSNADFPCNLNEIKKSLNDVLPSLVLSGETHEDLDCILDSFLHVSEASNKGSFFVGLEGLYQSNPLNSTFVRGIEQPISYGFSSILSKACLDFSVEDKIKKFKEIIESIKSNPFLFDEWKKFYLTFKTQNTITSLNVSNDVYHRILNLIEVINLNLYRDFDTNLTEHETIIFSPDIELDLYAFSKILFTTFLNHLSQAIQSKYKGSNIILDKVISEIGSFKNSKSFCKYYDPVVIDARNLDMADGIEKIYCEAAKLNKPLYVNMGLNHVIGIEKILKSASQGLIEISTRSSKKAVQTYKKILDLDQNLPLNADQMLELRELKKQFFLISDVIDHVNLRELQYLQKILNDKNKYYCTII